MTGSVRRISLLIVAVADSILWALGKLYLVQVLEVFMMEAENRAM